MIPYFDYPWALVAAPLLGIAVVLLLIGAYRRRARRLRRLGQDPIVSRLLPPAAAHTPRRRAILLGCAAVCAGIAFAGPRWGTERMVEHGNGIDMVLAMDASLSMLATDERPSRLERMKEEAHRLLSLSTGDRIGLIAFAGRSYILTPLTIDQGALDLFLDNVDPSIVGEAGTSLARAIRQGTDLLLATPTASDRALVVMSDGEAFEPVEDVAAAAKYAAESGVTLVTVGFGTEAGSMIPIATADGVVEKRDQNGQIVVTHYTPAMLQAAAAAGGTFIPASATDKAARVIRALATLRRQGRSAQAGRDRHPQFQLFLIPAVLLVLVDTLLAERRGRRRPAPAAATTATTAVAAMLMLGLLLPRPVRADNGEEGDRLYRAAQYKEAAAAYERVIRSGHDSPRLEYNLGTALMAAGEAEEAAAAFEKALSATHDLELRYRTLFNLGLLYLKQGRASKGPEAQQAFAAAADAYKRALRLAPGEMDAKWNYELANREQKRGGGGGGGGNTQQQRNPSPSGNSRQTPQPSGGLDQRAANEILNSAAREEQEVQARKQRENQPAEPPRGKDW